MLGTRTHTHRDTHTRPQGPSRGCPGPRCGSGASGALAVRQGRGAALGQRAAARPLMAAGGQREIAQTPPPSQPPPLPQLAAGSDGLCSARLGMARLGLAWLGSAWLASARLRASPGLCWVPAPAAPPVKPREGARAGCFFGEISPRSRRSKLTQNKCLPLID